MRRNIVLAVLFFCACALAFSPIASAATITPLTTFGVNGWLAPSTASGSYLSTGNNERGLAYGNGHVYLVSHASVAGSTANIRILNASTGADLGGLSNTGITGGTFAVNAAGVGDDGAIYVGNLTTSSTTTPFKLYKWANEASAPTVAYTGDGGVPASRVGDDLAANGAGSSTRVAAGYGSGPAGTNSFSLIDPTASTTTAIAFAGTPPNAGDFRLSLTFVDSSHLLGTAGSSLYRNTSFSGSTGTLINSPTIPDPAGATADRLLGYTTIAGVPILAVGSTGDSHVSIYDVTNPGAPVYIASANNTTGTLTTNTNASGAIAWGDVTFNGDGTAQRTLYTMSTNQGIQAFIVKVPEPATLSMLGLLAAICGLAARRRVG